MLTGLILTACVIAFIWGLKTIDGKHYADPPEILAVIGAPIVGIGALCGSVLGVLALVGVIVAMIAVLGTIRAVFSNSGGGQSLKGLLVVGAMIIALPPFWPIVIPLVIGLLGISLLCAPISLLVLAIRNFMDKK